MKLFNIIKTSFENYDETIKNYLIKTLGKAGYQYSNSQIFSIIFNGIKGVMQNILFYIEDALSEQNIDTAYRKSSIYSLAKIAGYEPYYGSAASGLLNCSIKLNNGIDDTYNKVYIKNYTKIINNNTGYSYIVYLPTDYLVLDLDKPLQVNQFKIIQGELKSSVYISTGNSLETIKINTGGLYDKDYVEVYVDGIKYTSAACLYDMYENSNEYVITSGYDNELDIMFGNGIHGKKLTEGQTITIKYIIHSGESGNIKLDDSVDFEFNDYLYDSNGNILSNVDFINLSLASSISGGSESDTIEVVKKMIGYNSRSLVLANENNFKLFFKRFSFIGQTNIWCENNSLEVNAICLTNYKNTSDYNEYLNAYDNNKILLSNYQKQMIKDTLNNSNKAFAGVSLNFIDPIIYKYGIICYVKLKDNADKDIATSDISNSIIDYFINIDSNTLFIAKSNIIKKILDDISYIDSIDITIVSDINESAYLNGYYYKYEKFNNNGTWKYIKNKKVYNNELLGLDDFGNINLDSKFNIPILSNNIKYCPDHNGDKTTITINATQIYFI